MRCWCCARNKARSPKANWSTSGCSTDWSECSGAGRSLPGAGKEQLLAPDPITGDDALPGRRHDPVGELLRQGLFDMRMSGRIDDDHAVLVEQAAVAFDQHRQLAAVLETEPGAAVGQHVGVAGRGDVQCGA